MVLRRRSTSTSLSLPTELNEVPTEFEDQCALYFGRKSWGKSTLFSQYPNSLVMMLEPGRRNLRIIQIPKPGEEVTWPLLLEYIELFKESHHHELMIDTVDRFYQCGLKWLTNELSGGEFDDPQRCPDERSIPGFYVSFQKIYEETLEGIRAANKVWILSSHDRKVTSKHPITGDKEDRIEPSCSPSAWKIAQSMCDYVFHLEFYQKQRVITVRDLDNISLASCGRDDVFLNPDGSPISRFAVPNVASEVYKTIRKAYDNQLQDISYIDGDKSLKAKAPANGAKTNGKAGVVKKATVSGLPKKK